MSSFPATPTTRVYGPAPRIDVIIGTTHEGPIFEIQDRDGSVVAQLQSDGTLYVKRGWFLAETFNIDT